LLIKDGVVADACFKYEQNDFRISEKRLFLNGKCSSTACLIDEKNEFRITNLRILEKHQINTFRRRKHYELVR
jgi:hypothetical protein